VLAPVTSERDFERFRGKLRGKFVLTASVQEAAAGTDSPPGTYSAEDLQRLATPSAPTQPNQGVMQQLEFARKRMQFYIDEDAAVLLEPGRGSGGTVFVTDGRLRDEAAFLGAGFYPWPDAVAPQVVVADEQYNRIARTLARGISVTLETNVANSYLTADPDSFNVVAEIPGSDAPSQVVMLGAHLDSWHTATGATDNAAGCAVMLEAMRILKEIGLPMRRTVRLVLWTGSEQGLLGSRAYVTSHFADAATMQLKPEHAGVSAYFNLDSGTGAIRGIYLQGNEQAAPVLEKWMTPFSNAGMTVLSPRTAPGSDHLAFDAVGLPAFHFIQDPLDFETSTRHSNMDVYDRLRSADLIQNAVIVASLAYHAANRLDLLPRKPVPPPNPAWAAPLSPRR
jgi:carboxypeptidase Q